MSIPKVSTDIITASNAKYGRIKVMVFKVNSTHARCQYWGDANTETDHYSSSVMPKKHEFVELRLSETMFYES